MYNKNQTFRFRFIAQPTRQVKRQNGDLIKLKNIEENDIMAESSQKHLYMDIKKKIRDDTAEFKPNTRIASRTDMAKCYNVTRTTIDKAVSELIGEGYLYSLDGSGTYISEAEISTTAVRSSGIASWGVILPNIVHDTYPEILRGIEDFADQYNINVIICNTDQDIVKQDNYIKKLIETGIQGIIIIPAISEKSCLSSFELLNENKIPFVFCNRGIELVTAPRILANNFFGMHIAANHLIELGYKNIAFISRKAYSVADQRYQGYLAAMYEAELPVKEENLLFGDPSDYDNIGYSGGMTMLQRTDRPDAILCFNDTIAKGLYRAADELGIVIGKDIGVVGYDDSRICEMLPVRLTSVRYPKYETGNKAAQVLLSMINGEPVDKNLTIILKPELIIRESSQKSE